MAQSLYPGLNEDDEYAFKFGQLSPGEQIGVDLARSQRMAERGAENIVRGLAGSESAAGTQRQQAGAELRALAAKVVPGSVEFYRAAADIFRKYGMVAEAEKMQTSLRDLEIGKGEQDPTLKMQQAFDELKKRFDAGDTSVAPAMAALKRRIDAAGTSRATPASDPEFIKLLNAYEAAIEAGQGDRAVLIKQALDAHVKKAAGSGADMTAYQKVMSDLAKEREARIAADKKTTSNASLAGITHALQGVTRSVDQDLQAAERLLVHPGTPYITGKWVGLGGRLTAAASDAAAGANALLLNVHAQTFLRALSDLRTTSKTSASGLGQLTEKEGDKIQNAKVALDPQQPTEQFLRTLRGYIDQLRSTRTQAASELTSVKADVPVPPKPIVDARAGVPDPRTVVAPPAAAPAKRTFKSTVVK